MISDAALIDLYWRTTGDDWAIPDEVMVKFGRAVIAAVSEPLPERGPERNPCTCNRVAEGAAFHLPSCPSHLAFASPTPTGPEPAKRPCCARPGWCACDPLTPGDEHCQWFVAATPEPTEETRQSFIEDLAGLPRGRRAEIFGPGGADPKETRE